MTHNTTIAALLSIWEELPALAGEQWTILGPQLKTLLEQFDTAPDSNVRDQIGLTIQQILETVPAVLTRFDNEFVRIGREQHDYTRGNFSMQIAKLLARIETGDSKDIAEQSNRKFIRYTDISCPRRVWIETKRITAVIRLTTRPSIYSDATEQLLVQSQKPVLVRLDAPGFGILNHIEQETPILPEADCPPLIFDLCPLQVGHTHLTFDFFQAGNPIGTATIPIEITAHEISVMSETYVGPLLPSQPNVEPPDFILYITYERFLTPPTLSFELRTVGNVGQKFVPVPLRTTPEEYASQIYRRLTVLTNRYDPTTQIVLGRLRTLNPEDIEDRLQEEGQSMWHDLIPLELQTRYAAERTQWQSRSLLIVSDEPHIPWELLWPYDPEGRWLDDAPLCLQLRMARWLRREAQGIANYEPEQTLSLHSLAVLVPTSSGLPAAQRERAFMSALMSQHGLRDASPSLLTRAAVKHLLKQGDYSWVHVAAHGNFYPDDPAGELAIWLEDNQPLTSKAIVGVVEAYLREHRPAFFFNACEVGRQGWAITGLGGWASRLISAGAGLFLAPQWVVDDGAALRFSQALYRSLLAGEPAAEAVRQGRLAARRKGDPTWLAYSLYAHPNARLV
jgi:hypothetical protein